MSGGVEGLWGATPLSPIQSIVRLRNKLTGTNPSKKQPRFSISPKNVRFFKQMSVFLNTFHWFGLKDERKFDS